MIRFRCEHCRQWLTIAEARAGATGKCPLCRQITHFPQVSGMPPPAEAASSDESQRVARPPALGDAPLELVREPSEPNGHADQKVAFYCELQDPLPEASGPAIQAVPEVVPPSRGRLIDVLLYPMSFEGLVRIAILALGLWVLHWLILLLHPWVDDMIERRTLVLELFRILLACYAVQYFAHCLFDSTKGGTRAPALWSGYVYTGGDLPSMMLIGAAAFCLGFAALYVAVTRDLGLPFWILASAGVFFLPMLLLACTLFGGREALNPSLIVTSIAATLPAYLGLVVRLVLLAAFAGLVHWDSWWLGLPRVLPYAADLYVLWIAGHLLGRFYLWQKDKLGWKL